MNILLVTSEYPPYGSGIANVIYSIQARMLKRGVKVDVLSRGGANINVNNAFNALPGLASLIPFWQKAADYIIKKANEYDVIWLHSPLLISAKKLRYADKIMVSVHTTYYGFYQAYKKHGIWHLLPYYFAATKLEHHFFKELSLIPNAIVTAVSPSVAEEAHRNGLPFLPKVVPNGLIMNNFAGLDKHHARSLLQKEYSLQFTEKDKILLYVGRITEQKQPSLLIDFFEAISCIKPNVHLIIAGSGNLLTKTRKKATKHHNMHILGHVTHRKLRVLLCAADLFISLSCYEGLPLTVLEATMYGLPLILSDIPAHKWLIASKVGEGMLADSNNPNLVQVLNFLNRDTEEENTHSASFKKHFAWESITRQYLALLDRG